MATITDAQNHSTRPVSVEAMTSYVENRHYAPIDYRQLVRPQIAHPSPHTALLLILLLTAVLHLKPYALYTYRQYHPNGTPFRTASNPHKHLVNCCS